MMKAISALDTPWKINNEVRRWLALPFIRFYFAWQGVSWGRGWRVFGAPLIQRHRGSRIRIGQDFHMRNWFSSNPLGVTRRSILATWASGATILIGDDVNMTGTTICANELIQIGDHIRLGANSTIIDTDFHPISASVRRVAPREGKSASVIIENDVFIGMRSMVLKGTHIGQGVIVGAGSVVSGDVPPGVLVAGNPAEIVREL